MPRPAIDDRTRLASNAVEQHIAHDTDNRPLGLVVADSEGAPDSAAAGKLLAREHVGHDDDRRAVPIAGVESAAFDEPEADGLEVLLADVVDLGAALFARREVAGRRDRDAGAPAHRAIGLRYGLDAADGREPALDRLDVEGWRSGPADMPHGVDAHADHARRVETRPGSRQCDRSARQDRDAGEQHHRDRDLGDDERPTQARAAAHAAEVARALQRRRQVDAGVGHGRTEPRE